MKKLKRHGDFMKKFFNSRMLAQAAIIAAIYCVLTSVLPMLSYGLVQIRFAEMLTILPCYTVAAIPGLFVGCALANLIGLALGATGLIDVFIGSAATLIAAILTYKLREKRLIALIPPVVVNALLVGLELTIMLDIPFYITAPCVAAGEFVACYVLGYTISLVVDKYMKKVF